MNAYEIGCKVKYMGLCPDFDAKKLKIGGIYKVVGQVGIHIYLEDAGTFNESYFQPWEGKYMKGATIMKAVAPEIPVESTGFKDPRPYQTTLTITKEEVKI